MIISIIYCQLKLRIICMILVQIQKQYYNEPTQNELAFFVILGFHYENECDGSNYVIN